MVVGVGFKVGGACLTSAPHRPAFCKPKAPGTLESRDPKKHISKN